MNGSRKGSGILKKSACWGAVTRNRINCTALHGTYNEAEDEEEEEGMKMKMKMKGGRD